MNANERWRARVERHALTGRGLRTVARLVPGGAPPLAVRRHAPVVPRDWRPLVSVIVPCFNYGRFLPDAVGSVLSQAGVDVEAIVVDDRSTDDSLEVAKKLAAAHPEVKVVANKQNLGHVRSFNAGWEIARGELVVKLDADDLLAPGALARAAAVFEEYPDVGLVYGHPWHFTSAQPPRGRVGDVGWTVWRGQDWLAERCRLGTSAVTTPEMVMRASLLAKYGAMDPDLPYTPDVEISLRLAAVSDVAHVDGADQALHREHAGSMSVNEGAGALLDLRARLAAFRQAFAAAGDHINALAERWNCACRALASHALRHAAAAIDRGVPQPAVDEYLEFAAEVLPEVRAWRSYRTAARGRLPGGTSWVARSVRRGARRLQVELRYVRWAVTGT